MSFKEGRVNERTDGRMDGRTPGRSDRRLDGRKNGWAVGRTDGRSGTWKDKRTQSFAEILQCIEVGVSDVDSAFFTCFLPICVPRIIPTLSAS